MGREIRRVPKDWEHPKRSKFYTGGNNGDSYHPLFDGDYDEAAKEWIDGFLKYLTEHPAESGDYYWDAEGSPPDPMYYRSKQYDTKFKSEPTCYQVYETVSEGTPVSPKFESEDELIEWLVQQGHSRKAAERFAQDKWVMSGLVVGGRVYSGIDAFDADNAVGASD